ncbi:MAG: TPM domain-containing protein [Paludibacteraceae bacterium]|nr:TPM domain-containing protein [Paludibacteraceae bacterium]
MFKKIYIAVLLCLCAVGVQAQYTVATVPNPRTTDATVYVANPDGIISSECVQQLQYVSEILNDLTGVELVYVVVNSIGDEDAFDFSLDLFNSWGIGDKEKNRGVLVFMSMEYHDIQIRTGGGVEGLLPDAVCSDIIWDEMVPEFREGDYERGLTKGAIAIYEHLASDEARAELMLGYKAEPVSESPFKGLSIISLLVMLFVLFNHWIQPKCPNCQKKGNTCKKEVTQRATYAAAGAGIAHYVCSHCGHKWDVPYTIAKLTPPSSSSSSGGRSYSSSSSRSSGGSFGGGRSFGGGAGGRW